MAFHETRTFLHRNGHHYLSVNEALKMRIKCLSDNDLTNDERRWGRVEKNHELQENKPPNKKNEASN